MRIPKEIKDNLQRKLSFANAPLFVEEVVYNTFSDFVKRLHICFPAESGLAEVFLERDSAGNLHPKDDILRDINDIVRTTKKEGFAVLSERMKEFLEELSSRLAAVVSDDDPRLRTFLGDDFIKDICGDASLPDSPDPKILHGAVFPEFIRYNVSWPTVDETIFIYSDGKGTGTVQDLEILRAGFIHDLVIHESVRGTGRGDHLLKTLEDWTLNEFGYKTVILKAVEGSMAHKWYLRKGYAVNEEKGTDRAGYIELYKILKQ